MTTTKGSTVRQRVMKSDMYHSGEAFSRARVCDEMDATIGAVRATLTAMTDEHLLIRDIDTGRYHKPAVHPVHRIRFANPVPLDENGELLPC